MTPHYERHDSHHEGIPVLDTILIELRELRTDFNTTARDTGERLSALETHLGAVVGGTQPGRLTVVEKKVGDLEQWRWRIAGIATAISTIAATLLHFWK